MSCESRNECISVQKRRCRRVGRAFKTRLLKSCKAQAASAQTKCRHPTRNPLKNQIPIRTSNGDIDRPGCLKQIP
jgi:hypothetical protein